MAAPGGVEVEPADDDILREASWLLGAPLELERFWAWAAAEPALAALAEPLRAYRPPLVPDPWEMLVGLITSQQVSLHSAFAVRSRLIERFGVRHGEAWAFPTRERIAAAAESEIREVGFSTRKAEYVTGIARGDLDIAGLADLPDARGDRADHRAARARPLDGRLVPRPGPRATRQLAGRRPRRAQGGVVLLRFGQRSRRDGGTRRGRTIRAVA